MASRARNSQNWFWTIVVMMALAAASVVFGAFVIGPLFQRGLAPPAYETQLAQAPEAADVPYGSPASAAPARNPVGAIMDDQLPSDEEIAAAAAGEAADAVAVTVQPRPPRPAIADELPVTELAPTGAVIPEVERRQPAPPTRQATPPASTTRQTTPPVRTTPPARSAEPPSAQPSPTGGVPSVTPTRPTSRQPLPGTPQQQTYFRVRVGDYASRDEATKARAELNGPGAAQAFVVPGSGDRFQLQVGLFSSKETADKLAADYRKLSVPVRVIEYKPDAPLPAPASQ